MEMVATMGGVATKSKCNSQTASIMQATDKRMTKENLGTEEP